MKFDTSNNQQPSIPKQSPLSRLLYHLSFNGSPTGSTAFERPHSPPESGRPLKYRPRQSCYSGLRSVLLYPRAVYPAMIFLNLPVLRMTWSIRLSTHAHATQDGTLVFFWLEVAELVRRWLWVFVQVEWGVIKKGQDVAPPTAFALPHLLYSTSYCRSQCIISNVNQFMLYSSVLLLSEKRRRRSCISNQYRFRLHREHLNAVQTQLAQDLKLKAWRDERNLMN